VVCVEPIGFHNAPPGVKVRLRPWPEIEVELRGLGGRFDPTRTIDTFLLYPRSFPVDVRHNSKIFREKLAVWADKVLGKHWNPGDNTPVHHTSTGAAS
jgi:hypothetical protein